MSRQDDLKKEDVDFLKQLFGSKPQESMIKPTMPKKTECPYCGKSFVNLKKHLNFCALNPEIERGRGNKISTKKRKITVKEEVIEGIDWTPLFSELTPLLKSLTAFVKKITDEPIRIRIVK